MKGLVDKPVFPALVTVFSAGLWGLFWIPLRTFETAGIPADWTTLAQFIPAVLVMLPFAAWRLLRGHPLRMRQALAGIGISAGLVLYCESLLLTDVVRALLLFYIVPVWGTILEVMFMGIKLTRPRLLALIMGLGGLYVVLGGDTGIPLPRNVGDMMALLSGIVFAISSMRIRQMPEISTFEHTFALFFYGAIMAYAMTWLPIEGLGVAPDWSALQPLLPWLTLIGAGFMVPTMWGVLWGSKRLDPGRLAILLQMEAVVGIASAAILTDEPFGSMEILGTVLIIGAGVVDVLGSRASPAIIVDEPA